MASSSIASLNITTAPLNTTTLKRVRFVDEYPKVIIYPDEDAYDADEWGEGFCMTYEDYRRNIVQEQEQRAQLHFILSRWRKAMEQKEKLSPQASPRTSSGTFCRFTYGDVSPSTQVNSFPHAAPNIMRADNSKILVFMNNSSIGEITIQIVPRSLIPTETICDILQFCERNNIEKCQLVSQAWNKVIQNHEQFLPRRSHGPILYYVTKQDICFRPLEDFNPDTLQLNNRILYTPAFSSLKLCRCNIYVFVKKLRMLVDTSGTKNRRTF